MRIAVATNGAGPSAPVEPVFGRADFFVIINTETLSHTTLPNLYRDNTAKAGTHAATMLINEHVDAILCGNIGPKAKLLLAEHDIKTAIGFDGTAQEAVDRYVSL